VVAVLVAAECGVSASQWAAAVVSALVMVVGTYAVAVLLARLADQLARDTAAIEARNEELRQRNAAAQPAKTTQQLARRYGSAADAQDTNTEK
jgi:hypothetical protein